MDKKILESTLQEIIELLTDLEKAYSIPGSQNC